MKYSHYEWVDGSISYHKLLKKLVGNGKKSKKLQEEQETFNGGAADDFVFVRDIEGVLDAGDGEDIMVFKGSREDYVFTEEGDGLRVTSLTDPDYSILLQNFESAVFVPNGRLKKKILKAALPIEMSILVAEDESSSDPTDPPTGGDGDPIIENSAPEVSGPVGLESLNEDAERLITAAQLLANASDVDSDLSVVDLVASSGSLVDNGDGTWTFTPAENDDGDVTFSYFVSDGVNEPVAASATLDLLPVNDAPVVSGPVGLESLNEDAERLITAAQLLANASDVDSDLSVVDLVASSGSLVDNRDGTWTFTPAENDDGDVTFSYFVSDGVNEPVAASATLDLLPVDEAPVNTAPEVSGPVELEASNEDAERLITAAQFLGHASDVDGDELSVVNLTASSGSLVDNLDGTWTYTPAENDDGDVTFSYFVSDGVNEPVATSATLDLLPVNDAPIAVNDGGYMVDAGATVMIPISELLANDSDPDGDALFISDVGNAVNGTYMVEGDMIHFTGSTEGEAGFDYYLSDGNGGTANGTVSVMVHAGDDTGDSGTDGHTGHDDGGLIDPPTTDAEIEAFVQAVMSAPEAHIHDSDAVIAEEHALVLDLVPRSEATHIAINHGDWNDPGTWYNGQIPGDGAKVLIPEGIAVEYSSVNDASLFTVRVDGYLTFATDSDSRLEVDTMVVSPSGHLNIGSADNPVQPHVNVDIVIANNGDIDVNWDPGLFSRGVISHGSVEIHGAEKTSHSQVAEAPMAGDTSMILHEMPAGWQVGDKLVLTGTVYTGPGVESQDEELFITAINGNEIIFDRALQYDHDTPREDLFAYVANISRNITFSSEDGENTATHHRGHVMFMHSDDVDVYYAAFEDLGRTDKAVEAGDPEYFGGIGSLSADTNVKGRYAFHFHKTGTSDQEDPAMAVGNVVDGSPGWGFVHHSSHANFVQNVSYDVLGAAFAAEDGDETGMWYQNMAIKSEGTPELNPGDAAVKFSPDVERHDNGRTGDGFFFAGRLVEAAENVAVNVNHGYVWMHRLAPTSPLTENLDQPEVGYGYGTTAVDSSVIQGFKDNEAFGTHTGLIILKANPDQQHDVRSVLDGFLNWETTHGVNISYTAHYTLKEIDLIGTTNADAAGPGAYRGVMFGTNNYDVAVSGIRIEGFEYGIDFSENNFIVPVEDSEIQVNIIDAKFLNNVNSTKGFDESKYSFYSSSDLISDNLSFTLMEDTTLIENEAFYFNGTKTDSLGEIPDRQLAYDDQGMPAWKIKYYLKDSGYYTIADGTKVAIIEDYVADRVTGELMKMGHAVTLDIPDWWFVNEGIPYNGTIDLGGPAADTSNEIAITHTNTDLYIDVLANDFDPDGGTVIVDGYTDAEHGDTFLQMDGTILYRPNPYFSGIDHFDYWVRDEGGNFSKATATILVRGADLDELYGTASPDNFVIDNETGNMQAIHDFVDGDTLDFSNVIVGYDPATDSLDDYIKVSDSNSDGHVEVMVNTNGDPYAFFETVATILDTSVSDIGPDDMIV